MKSFLQKFFKKKMPNKILQDSLIKLSENVSALQTTTNTIISKSSNTNDYLQEKLKDSTFRFFSVIDAIDDLVCIKEFNGKWKTLNLFGQKLYNLSPDNYLGKTDQEIITNFPNLTDILIPCSNSDNVAWENKVPFRSTHTFILNAIQYHFDIIKTPVSFSNGTPKELIIVGRDITKQINETKKNNACLKALNSASDCISILDKNKQIVFSNTAFMDKFPNIHHLTPIQDLYTTCNEDYQICQQLQNIECCKRTSKCLINNAETEYIEELIPVMNGSQVPIFYICILRLIK